jgi:hypothetical protein
MNIEEIREYCLAKPGVTEGFPFGRAVLGFKVMSRMYALTDLDENPPYVNLKYDPERAIELREQYEDIQPGYHMHKTIMKLFHTLIKAKLLIRVISFETNSLPVLMFGDFLILP